MKDVEVDEDNCPEADSKRKIQNMAIKSENCHQRLQSLQEKFHAMEELVSNMVQYKAKIGQLKQERFNLSVTYEENLQKYRVQVSELERENMMLLNDLKKLEAQCLPKEPQEENHALMERVKMLESKNSHLLLENDQQRVQYEKCLDEIANQVVQALIVQKTLKEECCQLQERVHDLEIQNQQLNLLFKQHVRQPAESVLKSYEENMPRMSTPPPWLRDQLTAHSDKLNAFSDRLSILSDHVTEAQIKASNQDSMGPNEFIKPSSNPVDKPSTCNASNSKTNPSRSSAITHSHDNFKSKQYATVRPLNCQQLPSLTAGESAISQDQSGWKMDFATINKGLTHQFDQDLYSDEELETIKKGSHMSVLSPNDILENSLDALATPENETGHEEPFPVFRTDICRRKNSATQMNGDFEKPREREKLGEPRKRCSCQGISQTKNLSHDGTSQTTIPNISRPDTLDLSPPTHNSDSPSQEDSQTSPLSPYLTKRYSRKKAGGFSECENNCCKPRQPSSSSSSASASHYSNTMGSRHKSRKDEKDCHKGKKSAKNSNYYSPEDPHPSSYLAFLAPFQQTELHHPGSKKLPVCAYGYSKSHDAEIRHSKIYHNGLEHSRQNLPFLFNKKTLPDVYLACSEWRKNVMSACAIDGEAMTTELKKLCSISSDSSYESIKAEHSGNKDDGYSTMSSDMQPEILERFSDSAMMKRLSGRNSFELNVDCCGKIVPRVNKSNNVAPSRNNRASSSPTDSEHSSDLNGASENFNSQEFFTSSTIISNNRQSLAARKQREGRFHNTNLNSHNGGGADNCTHTFPKFCCPSKRKSLLEASTSSSSSSFHQSTKSLHCCSGYFPDTNSLESSSRSPFLMSDANNTNGCDKTARKLRQSSDMADCKKVPSYSRFTFPSSQRFQASAIKRAKSDSHLFVKNSSKSITSLRDSLFFGNLDSSISDCTISLSDLSPSRSSQSPLPLTGSLRRSPWQPLVNVDQQDTNLSMQSKWLQKKFVLKAEHSPYNENKLHHTLGSNQSHTPAVDHTLSACHTRNTKKNNKENLSSSSSSSSLQSPDKIESAEQWLLQFSKEDIEKNLAFYHKRQTQNTHNDHCPDSAEGDHTIYWQTLQHKPHPTRIPVSRYMTLPISSGQANISQEDAIIPLSPVSPVEVEEQKKFRQEFYSLCCVESNRSLFSGCSHEENRVPMLVPLTNAKSEEPCQECTESDIKEIENVSNQIDNLSKTVKDLHLSFSSLNSVECNSDVGSDLLTPPSGHNSSLEGYHWVEDEFYLTPSSGDIIFSNNNSNESSASCEWMNEYVNESVEVFDLPEACDDEHQFMEKLCAVANKSVNEGKISGGKEKMSTPEKDVEDILVTNPQTRADLLDAMIDVSPPNGSDDSSNDDRMSVSKFKNKKGRQKTSAQTSPSVNFQKLFTRFGHQEEEAVSAFDFLDQFSTSSANSEPPLTANIADVISNLPQELQNYSPLSDPDITPQASPTKQHKAKKYQPPSMKALKHMENCSRSNQAKAAAASTAAAPAPVTSNRDLCRSYSTCSLESPEDGSASNLSLSDSCCE